MVRIGSPVAWRAFLCIAAALCVAGFQLGGGRASRALGWLALAATLGCTSVWVRAAWLAQPRLERSVVADVTGTVETVDHLTARDKVRLLVRPDDAALPPYVRISVDEDRFPAGVAHGSKIRVRARLAPPPSMALPTTYDFARDAWFQQIGAVGTTLGDVAVVQPSAPKGLDRVRADWAAITTTCASADSAVSDRRLPSGCCRRWLKLDKEALANTGGLAIYLGKRPRADSVADRVAAHPWAETASVPR